MKLHVVPASRGMRWLQQGAQVLRRQPRALSALFLAWCMVFVVLSLLPAPLGGILAAVLWPAFWLSMMAAADEARQGRSPPMMVLLLALSPSVRRHMQVLGALYCAGMLLMLALSALIDGGVFASAWLGLTDMPQTMLPQEYPPGFMAAMLFCTGAVLLLGIPLWHAPALVFWCGLPPLKALFFSTVACVRNMAALGVYGLLWTGLCLACMVLAGVLAAVLSLLLGQALAATFATALLLVAAFWLGCLFQVSVLFSFRDSFVAPPES